MYTRSNDIIYNHRRISCVGWDDYFSSQMAHKTNKSKPWIYDSHSNYIVNIFVIRCNKFTCHFLFGASRTRVKSERWEQLKDEEVYINKSKIIQSADEIIIYSHRNIGLHCAISINMNDKRTKVKTHIAFVLLWVLFRTQNGIRISRIVM